MQVCGCSEPVSTSLTLLLQFQHLVDVTIYSELFSLFFSVKFGWIYLTFLPFRALAPLALKNALQILSGLVDAWSESCWGLLLRPIQCASASQKLAL